MAVIVWFAAASERDNTRSPMNHVEMRPHPMMPRRMVESSVLLIFYLLRMQHLWELVPLPSQQM